MTTKRTVEAFGALLLVLLSAPLPRAEIARVVVAVDGLSCPFCVYGIEKKLGAVDGVRDVSIDLKTGLATVHLEEGASPDVGALRRAVEKAGFTPRAITLTVIGTLAVEDATVVLDVRDSDQRYLLFEKGKEGGPPSFDPDRFQELTTWAESATPVAVTGTVHQHADGPPGLSVDEIEPLHSLSFAVDGMNCERCAARLADALQRSAGVHRAVVSFATKQATVESIGRSPDAAALVGVVEEVGFTVP